MTNGTVKEALRLLEAPMTDSHETLALDLEDLALRTGEDAE